MRVPVGGDVDVATVGPLKRHLDRLLEGGCRRIILDMAKADYIDSSGVALVLTLGRTLRRSGGGLSLTNVSEPLMRVFALRHIADFIPMSLRRVRQHEIPPLDPAALPRWRLSLKIEASTLADARDRLREMLVTLPLSEAEIFDVVLAAGEAMGNTVLHTPQGSGSLSVTAYDDRVIIEAVDDGLGFSIADDEEPETTYEHGRGIKLMRLLVDEVHIDRKKVGNGTIARLVKLYSRTAG